MADLTLARQKLEMAQTAMLRLAEVVPLLALSPPVPAPFNALILRDAAIQRFEFAIEASWKAAQAALAVLEGLTATSPKNTIRASHGMRWIDDQTTDALLVAIDDRNLTSHTYDEAAAATLAAQLPTHLAAIRAWLAALDQVLAG